MRLHLGCGQRYLEGYRNVDFPASEHTVQATQVADELADLTALKYARGSVDEVRLHHVFEHFPRPQAAGLLVSWYFWLRQGGRLHIEVPDFLRTALSALNPFASAHTRRVGIRHIFGSHEARWAVHCEGWTSESLSQLLTRIGFAIAEIKRSHWRGTYNIEVIAEKRGRERARAEQEATVRAFFRDFILDETASELVLLDVWQRELRAQIDRSCGAD